MEVCRSDLGLVVRPFADADRDAVLSLLRRSWLSAIAPLLPWSALQCFARTDPAKAYVDALSGEFLLAWSGERLAGLGHAAGDLVAAVHVEPDLRGQGVGRVLMAALEADISHQYPAARLEVLAANSRAIGFYRRLGWRDMSRYPGMECGADVEMIEMGKLLV